MCRYWMCLNEIFNYHHTHQRGATQWRTYLLMKKIGSRFPTESKNFLKVSVQWYSEKMQCWQTAESIVMAIFSNCSVWYFAIEVCFEICSSVRLYLSGFSAKIPYTASKMPLTSTRCALPRYALPSALGTSPDLLASEKRRNALSLIKLYWAKWVL